MNCLDTNVLIDYLEGDPAAGEFIETHENEPLFAPVPAIFEVLVGAARIRGEAGIEQALSDLDWLEPVDLTIGAAANAARIDAELHSNGEPIGSLDTLIAGVARDAGATVVTRDAHFERVANMDVELIERERRRTPSSYWPEINKRGPIAGAVRAEYRGRANGGYLSAYCPKFEPMTLPGEGLVSSDAIRTSDFTGRLYRPFGPPSHAGVLVLHGSDPDSAFPDEYARLLALHGYAALRIEYFGTPGTPETLAEVPLAQFDAAIGWLRGSDAVEADRVGLLAWSRGTEAAFLAADRNEGVGALVAYSPSAYAFPAFPPTEPARSAWATDGEPVPFVAPYDGIEDDEDEPGVVRFRRTVERAPAERLERATLPVANIDGPVLLAAGADDRVWPSAEFAEELAERLAAADHECPWRTRVYEDAGHAITVPYEAMSEDVLAAMGGTRDGTLYAATDAWERTLEALRDGLYR